MRKLKPTSLLIAAIFFLTLTTVSVMGLNAVSTDKSNSEVEYVQLTR